MADLLKGNFKTKISVTDTEQVENDLEEKFEAAALKKLGGSMAYVAKKKVVWDLKDDS